MTRVLLVAFAFAATQSFAQKGLDEMIAAEKSFAAYSVANSTKEAFLKYIDTSAVMFENGAPVNGYQSWLERENKPGVLNWRPRYAEIAGSGDFGFTAGPWTFQPQSVKDSVIATGYFFTVWKKNEAGEWKFLLDVGTDAGPRIAENDVVKITKEKGRGSGHTLQEAEEAFLKLYKEDETKAYQTFMADNVIFAAEKTPLKAGYANWQHRATPAPGRIAFTTLGSGIASSGDLGYTYGSAELEGKKESWLRIWRHELTGWKIALQLIRL